MRPEALLLAAALGGALSGNLPGRGELTRATDPGFFSLASLTKSRRNGAGHNSKKKEKAKAARKAKRKL